MGILVFSRELFPLTITEELRNWSFILSFSKPMSDALIMNLKLKSCYN